MRQRKRPLSYLIVSIALFVLLAWIVMFLSPTGQISLSILAIPILPIFLLLLFLFLFSLGTYIFKNKLQGLLIGLFVVSFFLFRLTNLTHPFFFILLAALFLTVELMITYRK